MPGGNGAAAVLDLLEFLLLHIFYSERCIAKILHRTESLA